MVSHVSMFTQQGVDSRTKGTGARAGDEHLAMVLVFEDEQD